MTETLAELYTMLSGGDGTAAHFLGMAATGATGLVTGWFRRLVGRSVSRGSRFSYEGPSVPRGTLMECWHLLERIVAEAAQRAGWDVTNNADPAQHLHEQGIMTARQIEAYERLRGYTDRLKLETGLAVPPEDVREAVKETLDLTREVHRRSVEAHPEADTSSIG